MQKSDTITQSSTQRTSRIQNTNTTNKAQMENIQKEEGNIVSNILGPRKAD